jgi:hypothetical protein
MNLLFETNGPSGPFEGFTAGWRRVEQERSASSGPTYPTHERWSEVFDSRDALRHRPFSGRLYACVEGFQSAATLSTALSMTVLQ